VCIVVSSVGKYVGSEYFRRESEKKLEGEQAGDKAGDN